MRLFKMNEKGNLALAMAVVIIAFLSSVTMTGIALKDAVATRMQFDSLQETHLLRYQAFRGLLACRTTDYEGEGFTLPIQQIQVATTDARTTYFMKTKIVKSNNTTGGGLYTRSGYTVQTLVTAKRGGGSGVVWSKNVSPVKKYAEKEINRSTFAGYHYFTDNDMSENDDPVYFYGPDVIHGKVHSNSAIWVKQLGSGPNNGWPTFYDDVSTGDVFHSASGTVPYETIFLANYFEHAPQIEFSASASLIRSNGQWLPVPADPQGRTILKVKVNGSSYSSFVGHIVPARPESIDVWVNYPPPLPPPAVPVFSYWLARQDTVWSPGPAGGVNNGSVFSPVKTWIDGTFSGKQTWGCADTLFLIDNIKLTNTALGINPDGGSNPAAGNLTDFVGLVSERRIYIKYGYRDPQDSLRYHNTCSQGTTERSGIWIYAALCALGEGDPHEDGIFTFEYQQIHPSTPDIRIGNRVYTKIDLHMRRFPQTAAEPWPADLDYPWHNPLWPEAAPFLERGSIHLYGSVAQRRRGFVHRNTFDPMNQGAIWDFEHYTYGGASVGVNCVGTTGAGVGYAKDYNFDNRLSFTQPPDYPETHTRAGLTPFDSESWKFKKPPTNF